MSNPVFTPERDAALRARRHLAETYVTLAAVLNELPGPLVKQEAVRYYCQQNGLKMDPAMVARVQEASARAVAERRVEKARARAEAKAAAAEQRKAHALAKEAERMNLRGGKCPLLASIVYREGPVELPPPGPEGKVEADLGLLMAWTKQVGIEGFDGGNVERLNAMLAARKLPPVVVVWP